MPKLPQNPNLERLQQLSPRTITVKAGTLWHRIYRRAGAHPTRWDALRFFGPTDARFDHHELDNEHRRPYTQTRGITYLASDIPTCLAEVYQTNRTLDRTHGRPWLASFDIQQTLVLLDLTDTFVVQAGASMKLISGPRLYAQNWSRGFYQAYETIDGLYFFSSMTNRPAVALYERTLSRKPFPSSPRFHRGLDDPLLLDPLQEACVDIGYEFT